jgi:hypothetical protein
MAEAIADRLGELFALQGDRIRDEIRAGLEQTNNALRLQGARNRPIYPNTVAWAGSGRLVGWSIAGGASGGTVTVYDSRDTSGEVLAVVAVGADETHNHGLPGGGVSVTEACFVAVTGSVTGSLYLGAKD